MAMRIGRSNRPAALRGWPTGAGRGSSATASFYELGLKLAAAGQRLLPQKKGLIRRLPPPLQGWTQSRDLHPLAEETFMERWRKRK